MPLCWDEAGETELSKVESNDQTIEVVKTIQKRL